MPSEKEPWEDDARQPEPWEGAQQVAPQAFLDRVKTGLQQSQMLQTAIQGVGGAWKAEYGALTDGGQLGFHNFSPETQKFWHDSGLVRDPSAPAENSFKDGLRIWSDQTIRTFSEGLDAIGRVMSVPGAGIRGGTEGVMKALGAPDTKAEEGGAQLEEAFNLANIFAGGDAGVANMHVSRTGPMGEINEHPVMRAQLPGDQDFKFAARSAADGVDAPHVEDKLHRLYEEHGVLPAEAAHDAQADPEVKQALLSKGTDLPAFYAGSEGSGGAGLPPRPETPKLTPPAGEQPEPPKPGSYEDAKAKILDHLSIGENPKVGPSDYVDEALRKFVDRFHPIKRALEDGQIDPATADNPYRLARLFSGVGAKIDTMLNDHMFDFHTHEEVGPGLKDILAPVKGQLDDFRAFLVSARAIELDRRGVETGVDLDAAKVVGQNRTKLFEDTATKLYEFQRQAAAYGRDAGLLSRKGYEEMLAANKVYVPFHALMDIENKGIPGVTSSLQSKQPFHKIKGSERVKIDPLESVIKNTFAIVANADKNNVGVKLIDALLKMQPTELKPQGRALITISPEETALDRPVNEALREAQGKSLGSMGGKTEPSALTDMVKNSWIDQKPGEISIFRDGRRMTYQIDPELAEAFKGLNQQGVSGFARVAAPFARMLRVGAVFSPDFFFRHMLRDYDYAFGTYNDGGTYSPLDMGRGLIGMIAGTFKSKGELGTQFTNWMRDGGGNVSMMALDRNYLQKNLDKLTADTGLMSRAWNLVTHPLHPLQVANEWATSASHLGAYIKKARAQAAETEALPKGAAYDRTGALVAEAGQPSKLPAHLKGNLMLRDGLSLGDGMKAAKAHVTDGEWKDVPTSDQAGKRAALEAAWVSRDTAVDVARRGASTQAWNQVSAFFNVKVQDTARIVSAIKDNPLPTMLKLGTAITLPSVLLWAANKDNQRVQDLPQYQKDLFWIIPVSNWVNTSPEEIERLKQVGGVKDDEVRLSNGQLQRNDQTLMRYPKPFGAGIVFGTLAERMLDEFYAHKPEAFKGFVTSLTEQTAGDLLPTMTAPMMEQATGKSMMSGRNIVPAVMEGVLPEYQYTPYTTELAKGLGKLFGAIPGMQTLATANEGGFAPQLTRGAARAVMSPIEIENYVRGWTGTLGMYAFQAANKAGIAVGVFNAPVHAPSGIADIPFVKAFIARYPGSSQAVQDFYDRYSEVKPYQDTFNFLRRSGDVAGMERVRAMGGEDAFTKLDGIKKALGNQYKMIRGIDGAPEDKIPRDQKRQLIDVLFYKMVMTAKQGTQLTHQIQDNAK